MKILLATSEAVPFAKTGGLADVCGALPVELARLGHSAGRDPARLSADRYRPGCRSSRWAIDFIVPIGSKTVSRHACCEASLPGSDVPVYLVQQDQYFDRDELYQADGKDYIDNCERFVFFCRAVLEAIRLLDLQVDVIHANDWQTGLIPAYLKIEYRGVPRYEQIASLFTIHNMAYQGKFWHWDMLLTGLDWKYFNWHQMEFFGNLEPAEDRAWSSPTRSTRSARATPRRFRAMPLGCGLEGVLQQPPRRALGHPQRHRLPRVESGQPIRTCRRNYDARDDLRGQGRLQGGAASTSWGCPCRRARRWSA